MIRKAKIEDSNNIAKLIIKGWQTAYKGLINQEFFKIIRDGKIDVDSWNKEIDKLTPKEFDEEYKVMADFEKSLDGVGIALDKVNQISKISKYKMRVTILVENL